MNRSLLALGWSFVLLVPAAAAPAQEVENTSHTAADGSRVLQHRIVVPASLDAVWDAFTTTEGVRSWAVPVASVDFRLGGIWESSYRPDARMGDAANIRNRFISYLPSRMISMQAVQAPPGFPHPELLAELFTVIELEELAGAGAGAGAGVGVGGGDGTGGRVRVTISGVGYRDGAGYDVLHEQFDAGNAWSLQQLYRRFAEGPVDWTAILGGSTP